MLDSPIFLDRPARMYCWPPHPWLSGSIEVKLLCNTAVIFDSSFITDNVHVGDYTDLAQKRNLYRGLIGAQGVTHAAADKLDEQIRARNSIITAKRATERKALAGVLITLDRNGKINIERGFDRTSRQLLARTYHRFRVSCGGLVRS
jgi:hypothetical protein